MTKWTKVLKAKQDRMYIECKITPNNINEEDILNKINTLLEELPFKFTKKDIDFKNKKIDLEFNYLKNKFGDAKNILKILKQYGNPIITKVYSEEE